MGMKRIELLKSLTFWKRQFVRFRNPDHHGVSANYISQKTKLLSSLEEIQTTNFQVVDQLLEDGFRLSKQIANEMQANAFPDEWNIESKLASYLYAYVVQKKPKVVVETGVANGFSTRILMSALELTGGKLHSFDVKKECEGVYTGSGDWNFHLVPRKKQKEYFREITSKWEIDFWFHDGDHSYIWQEFEYKLALSKLAVGGLILSDDIDTSEAWLEFCERNNLEYECVFDSRKIFGIAKYKGI